MCVCPVEAVLQAMNRCHRIGQTKDVTCTLYYAPETIEERLEAWKEVNETEDRYGKVVLPLSIDMERSK